MSDWADIQASRLIDSVRSDDDLSWRDSVAAALRGARNDALMEAVDTLKDKVGLTITQTTYERIEAMKAGKYQEK